MINMNKLRFLAKRIGIPEYGEVANLMSCMHTKPSLDCWGQISDQNSKSDATFTETSGVAWHRSAVKSADAPAIGTNYHVGISYASQVRLACLAYYRGKIATLEGIPSLFTASEKFCKRDEKE